LGDGKAILSIKHVPLILEGFLLPQMKEDKSSTVAEMGDRLASMDMG